MSFFDEVQPLEKWRTAREWGRLRGYGNATVSDYLKRGAFKAEDVRKSGHTLLIAEDAIPDRNAVLISRRNDRIRRGEQAA